MPLPSTALASAAPLAGSSTSADGTAERRLESAAPTSDDRALVIGSAVRRVKIESAADSPPPSTVSVSDSATSDAGPIYCVRRVGRKRPKKCYEFQLVESIH